MKLDPEHMDAIRTCYELDGEVELSLENLTDIVSALQENSAMLDADPADIQRLMRSQAR